MKKSKLKITVVLPVSRTNYLDQLLDTLVNQTYRPDNIIVVFDGHESEYVEVRNKVVSLPFNALCVPSNNHSVAESIPDRRRNIVKIHNQIRELVNDCDFIWSVEDDGIIPLDALEKLVRGMKAYPDCGMVSGVELGRWGTPYVGAWRVDDVFEPKEVSSVENRALEGGYEEIDGCGLYCVLIRADLYKQHEFYATNGLGPDVNLGLWTRQQGYKNYIDWSIHLTHLTYREGENREIHATDPSMTVNFILVSGSTWRY